MDPNDERLWRDNDVATPKRWKMVAFTALACCVGLALLVALLLPAVRRVRPASHRSACNNNLHNIADAMLNYASKNGSLPPAFTVDANGKRLHSWRTLILPYLEQRELYESIDLTKPWDDRVNAKALKTSIPVYLCSGNVGESNYTTYFASTGPHGALLPDKTRLKSEITDDPTQTLLLIEVSEERSVPWMCPQDADETLILSLGDRTKWRPHREGRNAAFCDGSVRFLSNDLPAEARRAMISIAGGEKWDTKWGE